MIASLHAHAAEQHKQQGQPATGTDMYMFNGSETLKPASTSHLTLLSKNHLNSRNRRQTMFERLHEDFGIEYIFI